MLVLSRKIGEQIVLPGCGVTIAVLRISGSRVHLGFHAPPEISVQRQEIWDRLSDDLGESLESHTQESRDGHPSVDESTIADELPESDICCLLTERITRRAGGRICSLQVKKVDGRIVVSGRASTYYARQLACAAAGELLGRPNIGPDDVHFDIQVIPSAS